MHQSGYYGVVKRTRRLAPVIDFYATLAKAAAAARKANAAGNASEKS